MQASREKTESDETWVLRLYVADRPQIGDRLCQSEEDL